MDFGNGPKGARTNSLHRSHDLKSDPDLDPQRDNRYSVQRLLTSGNLNGQGTSLKGSGISPALLDVIEHASRSSELIVTTSVPHSSSVMPSSASDRSAATPPMLYSQSPHDPLASFMVAHHPTNMKRQQTPDDYQHQLFSAHFGSPTDSKAGKSDMVEHPGASGFPSPSDPSGLGMGSSASNSGEGSSSTRPFACDQCGKAFQNNSALMKHRLIHSDERAFICHICSKAFKRQDHLAGHLNVHKSVKPFRCIVNECDKSYCDARSLRRHLEHGHNVPNVTVHSLKGTMYVKCGDGKEVCMPMATGSPLSPGRVRHASGETSHDGSVSGADLSPASVNVRTPSITNGGKTQPVECQQCGRTFKNVPALNGHMRLHSSALLRTAQDGSVANSPSMALGAEGSSSNLSAARSSPMDALLSQHLYRGLHAEGSPYAQLLSNQPHTPQAIQPQQLHMTPQQHQHQQQQQLQQQQQQHPHMQLPVSSMALMQSASSGLYSPHPSVSSMANSQSFEHRLLLGGNSPFNHFGSSHGQQHATSLGLLSSQHQAALLQQHAASSPMHLQLQQMHPAAVSVAAAIQHCQTTVHHPTPTVPTNLSLYQSQLNLKSQVPSPPSDLYPSGSLDHPGQGQQMHDPVTSSHAPLSLDTNLADNAISAPATMLNPTGPCSPPFQPLSNPASHSQQHSTHPTGDVGHGAQENLTSLGLGHHLDDLSADFAEISTTPVSESTFMTSDTFSLQTLHPSLTTNTTSGSQQHQVLLPTTSSQASQPVSTSTSNANNHDPTNNATAQNAPTPAPSGAWNAERRRHYTAPAPGRLPANNGPGWMVNRGRHRSRGKPDNVCQLLGQLTGGSKSSGRKAKDSNNNSSRKPSGASGKPSQAVTRSSNRALLRQRSAALPGLHDTDEEEEPAASTSNSSNNNTSLSNNNTPSKDNKNIINNNNNNPDNNNSKHKPPPLSLPPLTLNRYCSQLRSPRLWDRGASQSSTPQQLTPTASSKVSPTDPTAKTTMPGPSTLPFAFPSVTDSSSKPGHNTPSTSAIHRAQQMALNVVAAGINSVPYTPPPILSPLRMARGLYCNINRNLSGASFGSNGWTTPPQSAPLYAPNRTQFWRQQRRLSGAPPVRTQNASGIAAAPQRSRRYTSAVEKLHWHAGGTVSQLDDITKDDRTTPVSVQLSVDIDDVTMTGSSIGGDEKVDQLDDDEMTPPVTDPTPHINVGDVFQADVATWSTPKRARLTPSPNYIKSYRSTDMLVFDPANVNGIDEKKFKVYLDLACSSAVKGGAQNKELAILLLHECHGDFVKASERLLTLHHDKPSSSNLSSSSIGYSPSKIAKREVSIQSPLNANAGGQSLIDTDVWTATEVNSYHQALMDCDEKDFASVALRVGTKSIRECVAFYYTWKQCHNDDYKRLRALFRRRKLQQEEFDATPHKYNLRSAAGQPASASATLGDSTSGCTFNFENTNVIMSDHHPQQSKLDDNEIDYDDTSSGEASRQQRVVQFSDQPTGQSANTGRDSKGQFVCTYCDLRFDKVKSLNAHKKLHRRQR